ncbi:hypothetical protein LCGC14_1250600 [marine sediment metagenome]|uniref:Rhamnogalacturonase A/B/Epimerase-like pectate lyase domain-containing protein n=1 Tax=marine sediment metagenome TaxID=412755 RepID=A0A0F9LPW8_9ZZZZ
MPWADKDALTPQNLNSKSGAFFDVKDPEFGATGDGTTDDRTALAAANTAATAETNGGTVFFPPGTYRVSSDITFDSDVSLHLSNGARLSPDTGIAITINGPLVAPSSQIFTGSGVADFTANKAIPSYHAIWWGFSSSGTAATNAAAFNALAAISVVTPSSGVPAFATVHLPPGVIDVDPVVGNKPMTILGANLLGHTSAISHNAATSGATVWQSLHTTSYGLTLHHSGTGGGGTTFHLRGIKFFGNQVGYGGVHFGNPGAVSPFIGTRGSIEDCWFNQFTTYGLTLRRAFWLRLVDVSASEIRDAATLSTKGYGIYFKANDTSVSSTAFEISQVRILGGDCSNSHIGMFIEEGVTITIDGTTFAGNNREGIKMFAQDDVRHWTFRNLFVEANNASRNDAGINKTNYADATLLYADIHMEFDTAGATKDSETIFAIKFENLVNAPIGATNALLYVNHAANLSYEGRTSSASTHMIMLGADCDDIVIISNTQAVTDLIDLDSTTIAALPVTHITLDDNKIARRGLVFGGIIDITSDAFFRGNSAQGYRFNNAANTLNLLVIKDTGETLYTPILFANLPTPANGMQLYCSDCTIADPCASGGNGAFAKRLNGVWVCN